MSKHTRKQLKQLCLSSQFSFPFLCGSRHRWRHTGGSSDLGGSADHSQRRGRVGWWCWKSTQACQAKCSTWTHSQALGTWLLKAENAEALADDIVFLPCGPSSGALRKRCWSLTVHKKPGGSPWCFVLLSASSPEDCPCRWGDSTWGMS